ncbi:MAG TPA: MerR family transcriptional regulator [Gemmataceae bacterium]|jgi:DNA-binding transcriptional MerR regulator
MTLSYPPLWTLAELSAEVTRALGDEASQANGRVREVPDVRTIRFYTTRSLIDRPAQMRGRTALYGERHLLQLVAIKRLQAKGLTLAEIQVQVVGQSNRRLRELARLPAHRHQTGETDAADRHQTEQTAEDRREGHFWGSLPAPVPEGETDAEQVEEVQKNRGRDVLSLVGVSLDEGVTLLLEAARSLDESDVEALRTAAAPLLKLLRRRQML